MVHNCYALLRGLWLMVTTDTSASLPLSSKQRKESEGRDDRDSENEHLDD